MEAASIAVEVDVKRDPWVPFYFSSSVEDFSIKPD